MKRAGTWLVLAGLLLVLGIANHSIWRYEQVRTEGRQVFLELRPVDPRSLIQGDYMMLRYSELAFPRPSTIPGMPQKGLLVLAIDADGVGTFARLDDGSQIAANEVRVRYRTIAMTGEVGIGAESFFFQEGQAEVYEDARYGVIRVGDDGTSMLVGLADENLGLIRAEP